MTNQYNWRIGNSASALYSMITAGIGIPSLATFTDHSARNSGGPGRYFDHGHQRVEILFLRMTRNQAGRLKTYVGNAGTGLLYVTIERIDGTKPNFDWIDISGYPALSDLAPVGPMRAERHIHNNVLLTLNAVTVVEEFPTF